MVSNVFISWSGSQSKRIAQALRDWLPSVLPGVKPWLSTRDIQSGARWDHEMAKQLEKCQFGIICITRENLEAPWLFFEAGALSKAVRRSSVCPYLVGVQPHELVGPMRLFQACTSDKASTIHLLESISKQIRNQSNWRPLFEFHWPKLNVQIRKLRKAASTKNLRPTLAPGPWQKLKPLDFTFIWGDLTQSVYSPKRVLLRQTDDKWAPPPTIAGLVWQIAYDKAEFASKNKRNIHFRALERICSARVIKGDTLELTSGLTMYLQFAATNLAWEKNAELRKTVENLAGSKAAQTRQPFLSSPLNVIGCIVSKDGCMFTPKRGAEVFERPDCYQASTGGFVERSDHSLEDAFKREADEELGILSKEFAKLVFLGFGYNEVTGEPDLLVMADCTLDSKEIIERFRSKQSERIRHGKDPGELSEIFESVEEASRSGHPWKSVWRLDEAELPDLFRFLASYGTWSQPSDRAVVIATLCRKVGAPVVLDALSDWSPRDS